jgi:hypothetical protein
MDDHNHEEDEKLIHVSLTGITLDETTAVKMVEVFSRLVVGLALDGINVNLNVFAMDPIDEFEEEEIEGETDS